MIVAGRWSKISDDKKKKLVQVFEKYITMNYLKMFQKIVNPSFKISSEKKIGKNYKLVKTHLILKNNEQIEINYLLTKKKINGRYLMYFLRVLSVKLLQKNQNLKNT